MIRITDNKFIATDASPQEAMSCIQGIIRFLKAKGLDVYEVIGLMTETAYKIYQVEDADNVSDL
jgi:hypothetical protein